MVVVVVVVALVDFSGFCRGGEEVEGDEDWLGMMTSGGMLFPKACFATQQRSSDLHNPSTFRMASQNPERRSATQTPGHVSKVGKRILVA